MRATNALVLIMKTRDINSRHLAALTGISRSAISQIVNGRLLPSNEELQKICDALGGYTGPIYPDSRIREVLGMTPEEEERAYERLAAAASRSRKRSHTGRFRASSSCS
jgi:transcriptional regulator with XRE-family HTH domain